MANGRTAFGPRTRPRTDGREVLQPRLGAGGDDPTGRAA